MGGITSSVLFLRIMVAVFMGAIIGLTALGIGSIVSKKRNKKRTKQASRTKIEKEVKTEKEVESEKTEIKQVETNIEEEFSNVTEFEHKGVKYIKYQYGESECVCKPENSSKWITLAQSLQNSGKLEKSKDVADHTLIVNKDDNFECLITGDKEELALINENNLKDYKTEIKSNIKEIEKPEVKEKTAEEKAEEAGV